MPGTNIKSVADLKRAMPAGTTVHVENHRYPDLSGERTVLIAQSAKWCLSFPEGHPKAGEGKGSWLDIPKAAHCTFADNAVTISRPDWGDTGPFCTITIPNT